MNRLLLGTSLVALATSAFAQQTTSAGFSGSYGSDATFNGVSIGRGTGNDPISTVVGAGSLTSNTSGTYNTIFGYHSLTNNISGVVITAVGINVDDNNMSGGYIVGVGFGALNNNIASYNEGLGVNALNDNYTGTYNLGVGYQAGKGVSVPLYTGTYNTYLGTNSTANADGYTNSTALGNAATITASNQVVLGSPAVTQVATYGAPVALGTAPTNSGSCAINTQVGGAIAGSFKANAACAAGTIILALPAVPTGYACDAHDMTTLTDTLNQSAYTTTSVTFKGTLASGDQVVWKCAGF